MLDPNLATLKPYVLRYRRRLLAGIAALLFADAFGLLVPWLLKLAIDSIPNADSAPHLLRYAGLIVLAVLLQAMFRVGWRNGIFGFSRRIEADLRHDYFQHLQRLSSAYYDRVQTGDLMSRATNDLNAVRELLGLGAMGIVDGVLVIAAAISVMLVIDVQLTLLTLVPLPIITYVVLRIGKHVHQRAKAVQAQAAALSAMVQESIAGIRVVKAYAQEAAEFREFATLSRDYLDRNMDLVRVRALFLPFIGLMAALGLAITLGYGGGRVIAGRISFGSFVAFMGYLAMLTWPLMALGFVVNLYQRGTASLARISEIFSVQPDITDAPDALEDFAVQGSIEFRELSFQYRNDSPGQAAGGVRHVLQKVSLSIPAGRVIGLVGPTGCGKSTLANLIPRFYDPPPGTLFVDGIDVRRIPLQTLRSAIGHVAQEPFLFSDSIAANITFGAPDSNGFGYVEDAEVAQLAQEVSQFPEGFATIIGERGVTLSGGQKQRLALARALARQPRILILDDAFSNVDSVTEELILRGLRRTLHGRTCILITHRVTALQDVDEIVMLDEGRIVERGAPAELLARNGYYRRLYQQQLQVEALTEELQAKLRGASIPSLPAAPHLGSRHTP